MNFSKKHGKYYLPYFRNYKTFSARRDARTYPEFTRTKRNHKNLLDPWDEEKFICMQKNWKYRRKCRKSNGIDANKIRNIFKRYDEDLLAMELDFNADIVSNRISIN